MSRQASDVVSELFKSSSIEPLDDLIADDEPEHDPVLDALYQQAVRMAQELGWAAPSREEFEAQYRREIAASNEGKSD